MTLLLLSASALLTVVLVYPLLSWTLSRCLPRTREPLNTRQFHYACLIPVYNNLPLAQNCIQSLLEQTYSDFKIYVIVDGDPVTDRPLSTDKVIYLYPEERLGSKHKSLHYALKYLVTKPDYVVIFDADNLAEPHYLDTLNQYASAACTSIQGRRIAKNLDTVYARLDAANEYYYNIFCREVPDRLRGSALTSGSGIAVNFDVFVRFFDFEPVKRHLNGVIHGEDKFLQAFIVKDGGKIKYTTACTVYDEKVSRGTEVSSQRARWFISYFKCLPYNLRMIFEGIRYLSWRRLIFGLHASYPPIVMLLGGSILAGTVMFFIVPTAGAIIFSGVICLLVSFPLFLIAGSAPQEVTVSLLATPKFIFYQLLAIFMITKAYNKTLVTQNNRSISIHDVAMDRKRVPDHSHGSGK